MTRSCYIGTRDIQSRVIRGPYCTVLTWTLQRFLPSCSGHQWFPVTFVRAPEWGHCNNLLKLTKSLVTWRVDLPSNVCLLLMTSTSHWGCRFDLIIGLSNLGLGVTKAPFVNFSVKWIFDFAKISVKFFESLSYVMGITTVELWWNLSNMNVIFNRHPVFWQWWKIRKIMEGRKYGLVVDDLNIGKPWRRICLL